MPRHTSDGKQEKSKALDHAVREIQDKFGEGSIMKLGDAKRVDVDAIPTGSLALDAALVVEGVLRGRSWCSIRAPFPRKGRIRAGWSGPGAVGWARWRTARSGSSWPMRRVAGRVRWIGGWICRRVGGAGAGVWSGVAVRA